MQNLKKDLVRLLASLITSPLLALAFYLLDTKINNNTYYHWLIKSVFLTLVAFAGYLTLIWCYRIFNYFNKK